MRFYLLVSNENWEGLDYISKNGWIPTRIFNWPKSQWALGLRVLIGLLYFGLLGTRSCNSYKIKLPSFLPASTHWPYTKYNWFCVQQNENHGLNHGLLPLFYTISGWTSYSSAYKHDKICNGQPYNWVLSWVCGFMQIVRNQWHSFSASLSGCLTVWVVYMYSSLL